MSRSRRKSPYSGWTTAESEKVDKQIWHSKWRSKVKQAIKMGEEPPDVREVSNTWTMAKDGKHRLSDDYYDIGMRK